MIEQFNKATGSNIPTNSVSPTGTMNAPTKSRSQEVLDIANKALADRAAKEKANTLQGRLENAGGYGNKVGAEQVAGAEKVKSSVETGAKNIEAGFDTSKPLLERVGKTALGAAEAGFGTISGVAQSLFAPITPAVSKLFSWVTPEIIRENPELAKVYNSVAPKLDEMAQKNPELTTLAGDILNTALLAIGGKGAKAVGEAPVKEAFTKETVSGAVNDLKTIPEKITTSLAQRTAEKEATKLQDMISPKLTTKEVKLAESQGRIIKGKEPTLLRGGTADTVIPSDKVIRATQTVQREIPNAVKMKEPELYTALEARTSDMAQKLQPEMQKVPIKKETVQKITDDWEALKKSQIELADATEEANVLKQQKQFEARLQKSKSGTMNDLWNTAKEYDASVPSNVKKANSMSSESLQNKKEIWLQNRAILRDAINDSANGMGEVSQKAFSDMHDMYNAKENLLSKAKVELKVQPSKVRQWIKENPWKSALIAGTILEPTGVPQKAIHLMGF